MSQGFLYLRSMCLIYRGQPHTVRGLYGTTTRAYIPTKKKSIRKHSRTLKNIVDFI